MVNSDRRDFFRLLARDAIVAGQETRGVRHIRLDRFAEVPDSKVGQLIPMIQPGLRISVEREDLIATLQAGDRIRLFHCEDPRASIFRLFNGRNTIAQISSESCQTFAWTPERSFSAVRELYLRLATLGIARTCNYWED
jgi:hypothetical protein